MKMWLVGAGYWGSKLIDSLQKFNVEANTIDVRNGQTIDDIDTKDPVMLATPLWQHHEQTCRLLENGHDVYVEKPMAETRAQICDIKQRLVPGQLLMVGHLFIHHPQMHWIKHQMGNGIIGEIVHVTSRRLNWGIYQTKTDPLLSLATHDISIVQEILGSNIVPKKAESWNLSSNVQPDRVWFSGVSPTGATFDIDVSWHWPTRTRQTVIVGTQGQIIWDQDVNTVTVVNNVIKDRRAIKAETEIVMPYQCDLSPLETELQHWINCLTTRDQPLTGIDSAESVATVIDDVKRLL